ncbi:hypothetical protein DIPPA_00238 [Diplonema papillatum]|nr:hypothetical protein DIPPA_00238 [Diplonema papillatum]
MASEIDTPVSLATGACEYTGLKYVDVGGVLELREFEGMPLVAARFVDQVSSMSARMRRLLLLTYKRLIVVEVKTGSAVIKRFHPTAKIAAAVGKEYSIGKQRFSQVLLRIPDEVDLMIEFPEDKRNPTHPDGQVCSAEAFLRIVEVIRKHQRAANTSKVKWTGIQRAAAHDILEAEAQLCKATAKGYRSPEERLRWTLSRLDTVY